MSFVINIFNLSKQQKIGNYRIIKELGHGSFGKVYLAKDLSTKELVAIKLFQNEKKEIDIAGFTKEAGMLLELSHPNIVNVLNFGLERKDNIPYLVMSYLPHKDLQTFLADQLPLSIEEVVVYVKAIAAALQHAHNNGIIHRDVKPQNILRGKDDEILLSDFGIATHIGGNGEQTTHNIIGTIAYIAPEQIQGQATPASDQYALAVVAYKWMCNTLPFKDEYGHLNLPPPPFPAERNIPPEVEKVIRKALQKEPTNRYATVQQFAKALEKAYEHSSNTVTLHNAASLPVSHSLPEAAPTKEALFSSIFSQWLGAFLLSSGGGAIIGILFHSALWAASTAPLFALLASTIFYLKGRREGLHTFSHISSKNIMGRIVLSLALFVLLVGSAFSAQSLDFSLLLSPYSATDTGSLWSFGTHTFNIGQQIYFGLGAGTSCTVVAGSLLALILKKDELFWLYLFIECFAFSLAMWLILAILATFLSWNFGLGASSLESLLALLIGVMTVAGTIILLRQWAKQ